MFQGPHPSIWKFVRCLGQEQILQHGELIQIQVGEFREKQHKQYESLNKRLVTIIGKQHGCNFVYFRGPMWDPNANIWDPNCHFGTPIVEAPETHHLLCKRRSDVHIEGSLYE